MGLLIEEFFGEMHNFVNGIDFFLLRWVIKLIFFILSIAIIIFFVLLFYSSKGYIFLIFLGAYILAEIFHFIRRSREEVLAQKMNKIIKNKKSNKK